MSQKKDIPIEEIEEHITNAVTTFMSVIAECGNTVLLSKILETTTALSIAIMRGINGNEYVEGYLKSAIADTDNVIEIEEIQAH